jgi:glycosyltransferase involved in cell wall biosynthesis
MQRGRYLPAYFGAQKANRALLEALAAVGCRCRVLTVVQGWGAGEREKLLAEAAELGIGPSLATESRIDLTLGGVDVTAVGPGRDLKGLVAAEVSDFCPDWTLVSEDWSYSLLDAACAATPAVVWLAHSAVQLPFGPFMDPAVERTALGSAAGVVTVSDFLRRRIEERTALTAAVLRFPVYPSGDVWREPSAGARGGFVVMVNPSRIKGIDIYLALARRFRGLPFLAIEGWATTEADRAALRAEPHVRLGRPANDVRQILREARVLIVPSLWLEAFGQIAVEAMLSGIPVLASDAGGLPEAKLGVDYVLPVHPIERYEERFDDRGLPYPIVPRQDFAPWIDALTALTKSDDLYAEVSVRSRQAAEEFVRSATPIPFLNYLSALSADR